MYPRRLVPVKINAIPSHEASWLRLARFGNTLPRRWVVGQQESYEPISRRWFVLKMRGAGVSYGLLLPGIIRASFFKMSTNVPGDLTNFLSSAQLFRGLRLEFVSALAEALEPLLVPARQLCLQEGDASGCLFVILSGRIRLLPRDGRGNTGRPERFLLSPPSVPRT